MSRFLYAWELGANLGHLGPFLPIARRLQNDGHEISLALRETRAAATLIPRRDLPWLQAPFLEERATAEAPLSYPDILLRFGFDDGATLLGHVVAWSEIFRVWRPQVVVADHAPSVLLAARASGLPVMLFGTGFFAPPRRLPMPPLRPWTAPPVAQLQAIEERVLATINDVLRRLDAAPLANLADLFAVAEDSLLGFPEFDHYEDRGPSRFWGHIGNAGGGVAPDWPATPGPRVFAYLRPAMRHFAATLRSLAACRAAVLIYCPELPPAVAEQLRPHSHLRLASTPVDLDLAATAADIAITYAPYATTLAFLQHGKPVLLVPGHLEQFLLARRVAAAGLGLFVPPEEALDDITAPLARLLGDDGFRQRAAQFAAKYRNFTQDLVVSNMTRRLTELAATA